MDLCITASGGQIVWLNLKLGSEFLCLSALAVLGRLVRLTRCSQNPVTLHLCCALGGFISVRSRPHTKPLSWSSEDSTTPYPLCVQKDLLWVQPSPTGASRAAIPKPLPFSHHLFPLSENGVREQDHSLGKSLLLVVGSRTRDLRRLRFREVP